MQRTILLALASIAIAIVVFALKYAAFHVTGSVAFYSDALESVINIAAALTALVALTVSARPADTSHPYGHQKVEYFSAVFEGVLIVGAAIVIVREAYLRILEPVPIEAPLTGIAISAVATAMNATWCWVLLREGRRLRSPVLVADGRHLQADVVTSVGVALGIFLAAMTGWLFLDPLLAGLVAIAILWSGWTLIRDSVSGLMDAAAPPDEVERIRVLISDHADGAIEAHDLRTRHAGPMTFVEFHLVVPGDMQVSEAHEICDRIEHALAAELGRTHVTIHVEPEDKAKHSGIVVL
jgi:cation diffusion facilitator family transporter